MWRVGVTAGDPSGVGPELVESVLAEFSNLEHPGVELRVIGAAGAINPGRPGVETSRLAVAALEEAARLALCGEIDAVVTGPVSKHELQAVGFAYPGQTEFFAARCGVEDFTMILTGGALTVGLATIHVALADVPRLLTAGALRRAARHLEEFCRARGIKVPRIAVAGLNPHAGEEGAFGREEIELFGPVLQELEASQPGIFSGPWSPDTVYARAAAGEFDAVLSPYHDQGLIPLKLLAFHEGVNLTWGLPFLRTSPDHGTAYGLAGRGEASPESFRRALELACTLRLRS